MEITPINANNPVYYRNLSWILAELSAVSKQTINDTVEMSGTTAATTTTYMQYAYNVVSSASTTNYAARLPNPPTKGKSTTIINTSPVPIVIYPSVTGGSINGVVNGSALIPNDGKPYVFFCYENPLPGAWTWASPATNQYDSGELVMNGLTSSVRYSGISSSTLITDPNNQSIDGTVSYDGKNKPAITIGISPDSIPYGKLIGGGTGTRIKLYSNFITTYGGTGFNVNIGGTWSFSQSCTINYYNKATGAYNENENGGSSVGTFCSLNDAVTQGIVSGTPSGVTGSCSAAIGDAGTAFIICDLTSTFFQNTKIGDTYIGDITINGIVYEQWVTRMIFFKINTQNFTSIGTPQDYKLRFFIEYN
jgi:hypothetical protein